jgi:hypothetical protein
MQFFKMDIGVGCFVFSQGVVYGNPHRRIQSSSAASSTGMFHLLIKTIRSSSPLFALGFVRLLLVKSTDYQEHTSEYGVHWNFFFTLAFLPLLVSALTACTSNRLDYGWMSVLVSAVHHWMLTFGGFEQWVMSEAPRTNLLSANREGITSLVGILMMLDYEYVSSHSNKNIIFIPPGYVAIFFAGSKTGQIVLQQYAKNVWPTVLARLLLVAIIMWSYYCMLDQVAGVQTSRRLVSKL